jgi:Lysyl oxidase
MLGVVLGAVAASRSGSASRPVERLPDLVQRSPYALSGRTVRTGDGLRFQLGFGSAVENVGAGPLLVQGRRLEDGVASMRADQVVRRSDGSVKRYPAVGRLRYTVETTHQHWHLLAFDRYELRGISRSSVTVQDRKTGFCLGDRYERDPAETPPGKPSAPVWTDECGKGQPLLTSVREGISVGYGDNYNPLLEGQYVDVTHLPAGRYELVHEANADHFLRETDYANNAASVVVDLSWPKGPGRPPSIDVVRRCGDGRRCVA